MNVVVIDIVALIIYIIGAMITFVITARLFGEKDERSDDNDEGIAWIAIMTMWPIVLFIMGFLKLSNLADQMACKIHDSFEDESESPTDDGIGLFERHN